MRLSMIFGLLIGSLSLDVYVMDNEDHIEDHVFESWQAVRLNSLLSQETLNAKDLLEARRMISIIEKTNDCRFIQYFRSLYEKHALHQLMGTDEEHRPYINE